MSIIQVYKCPKCNELFLLNNKKRYISHLRSHARKNIDRINIMKDLKIYHEKFKTIIGDTPTLKHILTAMNKEKEVFIKNHMYIRALNNPSYQFQDNYEYNMSKFNYENKEIHLHYKENIKVDSKECFGIFITTIEEFDFPKRFFQSLKKKAPVYCDVGPLKYFTYDHHTSSTLIFILTCSDDVENYQKYKAEMKLLSK